MPRRQADEMVHEPYLKQLALKVVRDTRFELASTTLVVASAMHIGLTYTYNYVMCIRTYMCICV